MEDNVLRPLRAQIGPIGGTGLPTFMPEIQKYEQDIISTHHLKSSTAANLQCLSLR